MSRKFLFTTATWLILVGASLAAEPIAPPPEARAHTYSIVARDPDTGDLGVAVQSHWFSVGSIVGWAEPGVGAVATQSFVDPSYGPLGLALMLDGKSAEQALTSLLAGDEHANVRQVAMIDASGDVAAHTGDKCIFAAGHHVGENYSVQANLMENDTVWAAMSSSYESAEGDLADRMLAAMRAAEGEGGDIRGMQSASMLIVAGDRSLPSWQRKLDLRVEDHPAPLDELERLIQVHRAYEFMNQGDEHMTENDVEAAVEAYGAAAELAPEIVEIRYWQAVTLASAGELEAALPIFAEVFAAEPRWHKLTPRLPASGLLPDDPELLEAILAAGASDD